MYRRVEKTTTDDVKKASDDPPPVPFKSSLQESLAKSPSRNGNGNGDHRGRPDSAKSPAKQKSPGRGGSRTRGGRGDRSRSQSPALGDTGRRVQLTARSERSGSIESNTSTSSSRWVRKGTDYDGEYAKPSLGRSMSGQDTRFSKTDTRRNGSYGRQESRESRGSSSSSQRRYQDEEPSSYRRVELSRESDRSNRQFKSSQTRSRRDSLESDTSEVSVRSTTSNRSTRSTRSTRSNVNSRYSGRGKGRVSREYGSRRSIDDGRYGDRLSLTSLGREDRVGPPAQRFERSVSDFSARDAHPSPGPAPSLRGSSLASSLATPQTRTPVKSSQDIRSTNSSAVPLQSSLTSSLRANTTVDKDTKPMSAPVFVSSLAASINKTDQQQPPAAEAPTKRLVDRLREEHGDLRSGVGLGDRSASFSRSERFSTASRSDHSFRDSRPGSGSSILSRVGDRNPPPSDKENRTRQHFAQQAAEEKKREAARRVAEPFQSSLLSSLAAKYVPSSRVVLNKRVYSLLELRGLKPTIATPCPSNLKNMALGEVIEVRPPSATVPGSSLRASSRRTKPPVRSTSRGGTNGKAPSGRERPASKKDGQRSNGGRRGGPPPPPLYDGPIEPLQLSENRWVPKKAAASATESTLSHVKSVLNKLTRDKFAKLTDELCSTEITSLSMLQSIIRIIMEKAIEEPSFAVVYADLCKKFHTRTVKKVWEFVRAVRSVEKPGVYLWTAVELEESPGFEGPYSSEQACLDAADSNAETPATNQDMRKAYMITTSKHLIAIVEAGKGSFYYKKQARETLKQEEPLLGEWGTPEEAIKAAQRMTAFKKLLVTGCQDEFERPTQAAKTTTTDNSELDQRQKDVLATRAKRRMIGNIRFIGELFKADFLHQAVVQGCILHLLGVDLVETSGQLAGQEVRLPDDEELEALCKLLATVGKKYDQPEREGVMRIIILRVVELSDDKRLPSRMRFLLKDVLEMRDHLWEPRRKELQQKTLEEVRREAMLLQQQGKNAQHDNVANRRLKSQVSSAQLAKESSNLLVRKDTQSESSAMEPASPGRQKADVEEDPAKIQTRIKSIIQEYSSIHDIDEATACVRELSAHSVLSFVEESMNRALEGKEQERCDAVDLLVKLYTREVIDATAIQLSLVNVLEFLEDIKIDTPLVHQYCALLLGRLIASGCFGLSWMVSKALAHLVESGLASLVFAETLSVIASESEDRVVARMIVDEELQAASVLPRPRRDDDAVAKFIEEHQLEVFFGGERPHDEVDDADLDPEVESKMRSTLEEYLSVKDLEEVVLCVKELADAETASYYWRHFLRVCVVYAIDSKQSTRIDVASLIHRLLAEKTEDIDIEDVEWGFESALMEYEDVRVDVPKVADNYAELWVALFEMEGGLTLQWLHDATMHLIPSGYAAEILSSLLGKLDTQLGREKLVAWWQQQGIQGFESFSSIDAKSTAVHDRLRSWQQIFLSP